MISSGRLKREQIQLVVDGDAIGTRKVFQLPHTDNRYDCLSPRQNTYTQDRGHVSYFSYNIADEACEDTIYDVPVFRRPYQIDLEQERMADSTTPLNFRHLREKHGLNAVLLAWIGVLYFCNAKKYAYAIHKSLVTPLLAYKNYVEPSTIQ